MPRNVLKRLRRLLRARPKHLLCCVALLVGCAAPVKVVSECPEPSPAEAEDLSAWLIETPERPAQDWAARVVGHLYPDELDAERGVEDQSAGWLVWPLWRSDE